MTKEPIYLTIDKDIVRSPWRCLGCIVATLEQEGIERTRINRYAGYVAKQALGNQAHTFQIFLTMKQILQKEFGWVLCKGDKSDYKMKDFRQNGTE